MNSRSGSPSADRTTWSSQIFSLSVFAIAVRLSLLCRMQNLPFHHSRRQYQGMDNTSGVGVLDKAAQVLSALETGPTTLAGLVAATGLARPTAHRLAVALEHHRLVSRDLQGRFILGPRLGELAPAARASTGSASPPRSGCPGCVTACRSAPS